LEEFSVRSGAPDESTDYLRPDVFRSGLVDLVDQLPPELITLDADDFTALIACTSEIRHWVEH